MVLDALAADEALKGPVMKAQGGRGMGAKPHNLNSLQPSKQLSEKISYRLNMVFERRNLLTKRNR